MNNLIAALLVGITTIFVFDSRCGDKISEARIEVHENADGTRDIRTRNSYMTTSQTMDGSFRTSCWKMDRNDEKTSICIKLKDGVYHISGTLKGKAVDKRVKTKGEPWVQNIGYAAGHRLKGKTESSYECFNPLNLSLTTLTVHDTGETTVDGRQVITVENAPTGALAKFWHNNYLYDKNTRELIGYRGVEGFGEKETRWTLKTYESSRE